MNLPGGTVRAFDCELGISAQPEGRYFRGIDLFTTRRQQDVSCSNPRDIGRAAFVCILKEPALSPYHVDGTERCVDGMPCRGALRTFVEERDVAEDAARDDCVHSRLEFRGRTGACEVLELLREQRSPIRVASVEADALAFQKAPRAGVSRTRWPGRRTSRSALNLIAFAALPFNPQPRSLPWRESPCRNTSTRSAVSESPTSLGNFV